MDFKLTPAQEAFKKEVGDFLKDALPPGQFREEAAQSPDQKVLLDEFLRKRARFDEDSWVVELDIADPERFIAETTAAG